MATRGVLRPLEAKDVAWSPWKGEAVLRRLQLARDERSTDDSTWCWEGWELLDARVDVARVVVPWKTPWKNVLVHVEGVDVRIRRCASTNKEDRETDHPPGSSNNENTRTGASMEQEDGSRVQNRTENDPGTSKAQRMAQRMAEALLQRLHVVVGDLKIRMEGEEQCLSFEFKVAEARSRSGSIKHIVLTHGSTPITTEPVDVHASIGRAEVTGNGITPVRLRTTPIRLKVNPSLVQTLQNLFDASTPDTLDEDNETATLGEETEAKRVMEGQHKKDALLRFRKVAKQIIVAAAVAQTTSLVKDEEDAERFFDALSDNLGDIVARGKMVDINGRVDSFTLTMDDELNQSSFTLTFSLSRFRLAIRKQPPLRLRWKIGAIRATTPKKGEVGVDSVVAQFCSPGEFAGIPLDSTITQSTDFALDVRLDWASTNGQVACASGTVGKIEGSISSSHALRCFTAFAEKSHVPEQEERKAPAEKHFATTDSYHSRILRLAERAAMSTNATASVRVELSSLRVNLSKHCGPQDRVRISVGRFVAKNKVVSPEHQEVTFQREREILSQALALQNDRMIKRALRELDRAILSTNWQLRLDGIHCEGNGPRSPSASFRRCQLEVMLGETVSLLAALEATSLRLNVDVSGLLEQTSAGASGLEILFGECSHKCSLQMIGVERVRLDASQLKSGKKAMDLQAHGWNGSFFIGHSGDVQCPPSLMLKWKQEEATGRAVGISVKNMSFVLPEELIQAIAAQGSREEEDHTASTQSVSKEKTTPSGEQKTDLKEVKVFADNLSFRLMVAGENEGARGLDLVLKKFLVLSEPGVRTKVSITHAKLAVVSSDPQCYLHSCLSVEAGLIHHTKRQIDVKLDVLMVHMLAKEAVLVVSLVEDLKLAFGKSSSNELSDVQLKDRNRSQHVHENGARISPQCQPSTQGTLTWSVHAKRCSLKSWCSTLSGDPLCLFLDGFTYKQQTNVSEIAFIGLGLSEENTLGALLCPCGPFTWNCHDRGIASSSPSRMISNSLIDLSGMKLQIDLPKVCDMLVRLRLAATLWTSGVEASRQRYDPKDESTGVAGETASPGQLHESNEAVNPNIPSEHKCQEEIQAACRDTEGSPCCSQPSYLQYPTSLQSKSKDLPRFNTPGKSSQPLGCASNGTRDHGLVSDHLPGDGFLPMETFPWNVKHPSTATQAGSHHLKLSWAVVELLVADKSTSMVCVQGLQAVFSSDGSAAVGVDSIAAALKMNGRMMPREEMSHYKAEHSTPMLLSPFTPRSGAVDISTPSSKVRTSLDSGLWEASSVSREGGGLRSLSSTGEWPYDVPEAHPVTKLLQSIEKRSVSSTTAHTLHWNKIKDVWTTWDPNEELVQLAALRLSYCKEAVRASSLQAALDTLVFHVTPGKIDAAFDHAMSLQSNVKHISSADSAKCVPDQGLVFTSGGAVSNLDTAEQLKVPRNSEERPTASGASPSTVNFEQQSVSNCTDCVEPRKCQKEDVHTRSCFFQLQVCRGFVSFGSRKAKHFEAGLCPMNMAALYRDGELDMSSSISVAADVRESQAAPWESLIVPWQCGLHLQASTSNSRKTSKTCTSAGPEMNNGLHCMSVALRANNDFEVCCSSSAARLISDDMWWRDADQGPLAWLVNETGEDVIVWIPHVAVRTDFDESVSARSSPSGTYFDHDKDTSPSRAVKRLFGDSNSLSKMQGYGRDHPSSAPLGQVMQPRDLGGAEPEHCDNDVDNDEDVGSSQSPESTVHQGNMDFGNKASSKQASGNENLEWAAPIVVKAKERIALPTCFSTGTYLHRSIEFPKSANAWIRGTDQECSYQAQETHDICIGIGRMSGRVSLQGSRATIGFCGADPALSRIGSSLLLHSPLCLSNHGCGPLMISHVLHAFTTPSPFTILQPGDSIWAPLSICLQGGHLRICPLRGSDGQEAEDSEGLEDMGQQETKERKYSCGTQGAKEEIQKGSPEPALANLQSKGTSSERIKSQELPGTPASSARASFPQSRDYSWSNLIPVQDIFPAPCPSKIASTAICEPLPSNSKALKKGSLCWKVVSNILPSASQTRATSGQNSAQKEYTRACSEDKLLCHEAEASNSFAEGPSISQDLDDVCVASPASSPSSPSTFCLKGKGSQTQHGMHSTWHKVNVVFMPSLVVESDLPLPMEVVVEDMTGKAAGPTSETRCESFSLSPLGCWKAQSFNLLESFSMSIKPSGYRWSKPVHLGPQSSSSVVGRCLKHTSGRVKHALLSPVESTCGAPWPLEVVIERVPGGRYTSDRVCIRASVVLTNETECTYILHDRTTDTFRKLNRAQQPFVDGCYIAGRVGSGPTESREECPGPKCTAQSTPLHGKVHDVAEENFSSSPGTEHLNSEVDGRRRSTGTQLAFKSDGHTQSLSHSPSFSELGISLHGMAWQRNLPLALSLRAVKSIDGLEWRGIAPDENNDGLLERTKLRSDIEDCCAWSQTIPIKQGSARAATFSVPVSSGTNSSLHYNKIICASSSYTPHGTVAVRFFHAYRFVNSLTVPVQIQQLPVGKIYRVEPGVGMGIPWLDIPTEPDQIRIRTKDCPWSKPVPCGCNRAQTLSLIVERCYVTGLEESRTASGMSMSQQESSTLATSLGVRDQGVEDDELLVTAADRLSTSRNREEATSHELGDVQTSGTSYCGRIHSVNHGSRLAWSNIRVDIKVRQTDSGSRAIVLGKSTNNSHCTEALVRINNTTGYDLVVESQDWPSLKIGRYSSGTLENWWNSESGGFVHLHLEGKGELGSFDVESSYPQIFHKEVGRGTHKTKVTVGLLRQSSERILILSTPGCWELEQLVSQCWSPEQGLHAPHVLMPNGTGIIFQAEIPRIRIAVANADSPLAHLCIEQVDVNFLTSARKGDRDALDLAVTVRSIQVDNLTDNAHYSVPLATPWPNGRVHSCLLPLSEPLALQQRSEQGIRQNLFSTSRSKNSDCSFAAVPAMNLRVVRTSGTLRLGAIQMAPLLLQMDDMFIRKLCEVASCFSLAKSTVESEETVTPEQCAILGACMPYNRSAETRNEQECLERLEIAPVWIEVSYAHTSRGATIFALSGINHAPFSMPAWSFKSFPRCGPKDVTDSLLQHCARAGVTELISVLASASLLGDPRAAVLGMCGTAFSALFTTPLRLFCTLQAWGEQLSSPWYRLFEKYRIKVFGRQVQDLWAFPPFCNSGGKNAHSLIQKLQKMVHCWSASSSRLPFQQMAPLPEGSSLTPPALLRARGVSLACGQNSCLTVELEGGRILLLMAESLCCVSPPPAPAAATCASDPPSNTSQIGTDVWSVKLDSLIDVALSPRGEGIRPSIEGKVAREISLVAVAPDTAMYPFVSRTICCRTEEATDLLFDKLKALTVVYFDERNG